MKHFIPLALAVLFAAACNNTDQQNQPTQTDSSNTVEEPALISYQLLAEHPHDTGAFTQGLIWNGTNLVEGTGQLEESNLRVVELPTGRVIKQVANKPDIFGEGITQLNGKIYQLTWQNKLAYRYDAATLKLEKEFPLNTEGWGLTHNGKELILSDGSSNLYFLDPETFRETRRIGVYDNLGPRSNFNELEWINGFVFANVWQSGHIVKIDPASGRIVGRIELGDLVQKAGIVPDPYREHGPDVLNGIAWDSTGNRLFITGKYWPKLFEIRLQ